MRLRTPNHHRRPEPRPLTLAERDDLCSVMLRGQQDDDPDCSDLLGAIHFINHQARKYTETSTGIVEILRGMQALEAEWAVANAIDKAIGTGGGVV